jgi:hypothetical protein
VEDLDLEWVKDMNETVGMAGGEGKDDGGSDAEMMGAS